MVKLSSRRVLFSGGGRFGRDQILSKEEKKLLPHLLQLLRSGALSFLLSSTGYSTAHAERSESIQASPTVSVSPVSRRNAGKPSRPPTPTTTSKNPAEPGWTRVKRQSAATTPVKDKLLSDRWSVPIVGCIAELKVGEPGVCLVSSSEARKAIQELKSDHALAILSPSNIDNRGEELHVLMEDASGRVVVRRRFLLQLSAGTVTYMDGKPKRQFKQDSVKVDVSFAKIHTKSEA